MADTRKCPYCGGTQYHNTGISKTGNKYENWKCGSCKKVDWVDLRQPKEARMGSYEESQRIRQQENERREEGLSWGNAKNCASVIVGAMIKAGSIQKDDWETYFKNITQKIFEFDETE